MVALNNINNYYFIILMLLSYIPNDLLHIILDYDGRIKYKKGKYVNIIHKYDIRYNIITPLMIKKNEIMKDVEITDNSGFYFEFGFDIDNRIGLCYDFNFSFEDKFEICYYDLRNNSWVQIRTYL
jgi:hypothetical protein